MDKSEPLFQSIFGQQWEMLPEALRKRYANRPYSNDVITVEGTLDIYYSPLVALFMPLFRLFNVLVPYQGKNIPILVNFISKPNSPQIYFERTCYFPSKKPHSFFSYQQAIKEDEVIEFMRLGLGWRLKCSYNSEKVKLQHRGYVWKIGGRLIPIPLSFLLGNIYAEEQAISDNSFRMLMTITHPLLGKIYEYGGVFKLKSAQ